MSTAPRFVPYVSIALVALNLVGFGVELAGGADLMWGPAPPVMFELGGNFGPSTLDGEPWRLVTSMFLHYGIIHLAMNLFFGFYLFGQHVERMFGRPGFLALYLVSGVAGSLVSAVSGRAVSAGASGAVFGIIGAFGAYLVLHRDRLDPVALRKQARSLVILLGLNIAIGLRSPVVDLGAHLGGLVAGFGLGLALEARHRPGPDLARRRRLRALVIGVAGAALVLGAAYVVPRPTGSDRALVSIRNAEQLGRELDDRAPRRHAEHLERAVIPAWRQAVGDLERDRTLPDDFRDLALRYARARRDQMTLLLDAIHAEDPALLDRARERSQEADAIVTELNQLAR